MAEATKIQWCDATFNPWRGCTKVSAGCAHCYAESLSGRNPKVLGVWGPSGTRVVAADSQWREPLKWDRAAAAAGERRRVFCASLGDVFEDWRGPMVDASGRELPVSMGHVRFRLFDLIANTPHLDWLLLTKRPGNVPEFVPEAWHDGPPANVWLGASVEDQAAADARIPHLLAAPARVRFLSMEPLLGPVALDLVGIDWVIVGGESGGGARAFDPAWARAIRDQCRRFWVAFFFKQSGTNPVGLTVRGKGGDPDDIPADLMVREFPTAT